MAETSRDMTFEIKFCELAKDVFPLTVDFFELDDHKLSSPIWHCEVSGPGFMEVPGFGRVLRIRIRYGDGHVEFRPPLPAFVCPVCQAASYHPKDGEEGYCGRCHAYTRQSMF